jgi:hypothetical protein
MIETTSSAERMTTALFTAIAVENNNRNIKVLSEKG